ncbi:MAG: hypothetical protein GY941_24555 [Planctomycetes bacterium]|nr:hypothetical protein [Planctomycetota bacterium]
MMDYALFKDNLDRIINRGGHGNRTVSVDVLKRCKAVIEDNESLTGKLRAIEATIKDTDYQQERNEPMENTIDASLESAITEAGRDKVFAVMDLAGWSRLDSPPKWVWWDAIVLVRSRNLDLPSP